MNKQATGKHSFCQPVSICLPHPFSHPYRDMDEGRSVMPDVNSYCTVVIRIPSPQGQLRKICLGEGGVTGKEEDIVFECFGV